MTMLDHAASTKAGTCFRETLMLCQQPCTRAAVRVQQEMKVAATAYYAEEAKAKAERMAKLSKFRESIEDAAARKLQQMYHVFSVSAQ